MQIEVLSYAVSEGWSRPLPRWDSPSTLVLVFGAPEFAEHRGPLDEIRETYPNSQILGCSTAGEILRSELRDGTLSVAIAQFEHTRLRAADATVATSEESRLAGRSLAQSLRGEDLQAIFLLSDGLGVNGTELVEGLNSELPSGVVATGGLAADGNRFRRTWVFDGTEARQHVVRAVALYGNRVRVGHGSKGGWDMFGPLRTVTKSRGSVLYELDGKPALALYKQYLGDRARDLPGSALLFPLALRESSEDSKVLVRTILAVDEGDQSMTFAGTIPQGHRAQLMRANFERLIGGACDAALETRETHGQCDGSVLSVAVSCVGRRLILGERTEEEIEAALAELPRQAQQVGFYSYGEISPYGVGSCDLHNQTMTLTTVSEK
ncbi:MAG: FIST C-terminal domain-containing protein [Planctomycetes bacterium]|nr:FIST C-terminal domain-containing protein [Planctomycetota bacterium]